MWNPDISIEKWLNINPALKSAFPLECLCGNKIYKAKPYVEKNWLGIISSQCICGLPPCSASIPRNEELRDELRSLILNNISKF
jgi:hypothetical protein